MERPTSRVWIPETSNGETHLNAVCCLRLELVGCCQVNLIGVNGDVISPIYSHHILQVRRVSPKGAKSRDQIWFIPSQVDVPSAID